MERNDKFNGSPNNCSWPVLLHWYLNWYYIVGLYNIKVLENFNQNPKWVLFRIDIICCIKSNNSNAYPCFYMALSLTWQTPAKLWTLVENELWEVWPLGKRADHFIGNYNRFRTVAGYLLQVPRKFLEQRKKTTIIWRKNAPIIFQLSFIIYLFGLFAANNNKKTDWFFLDSFRNLYLLKIYHSIDVLLFPIVINDWVMMGFGLIQWIFPQQKNQQFWWPFNIELYFDRIINYIIQFSIKNRNFVSNFVFLKPESKKKNENNNFQAKLANIAHLEWPHLCSING